MRVESEPRLGVGVSQLQVWGTLEEVRGQGTSRGCRARTCPRGGSDGDESLAQRAGHWWTFMPAAWSMGTGRFHLKQNPTPQALGVPVALAAGTMPLGAPGSGQAATPAPAWRPDSIIASNNYQVCTKAWLVFPHGRGPGWLCLGPGIVAGASV